MKNVGGSIMSNVIYAYKKKDNDKIVYVGQTTNLKNRHKQHIYIMTPST